MNMNEIFQQLKINNSKTSPKAWNISVEITQRILCQNEMLPKLKTDYNLLKERHTALKRLSNKAVVESRVSENQLEINRLEKSVNDLKNKLKEIISKKQKIQDKIEESKQKKSDSEKKNDLLIFEIEEINKQIENIEQSILKLNSKFDEKDNIIESLNYIIQAEEKMSRIIAQVKNKNKKVHFYQDSENKNTAGVSLDRFDSNDSVASKPRFNAKNARKRAKSFSASTSVISQGSNSNLISSTSEFPEALPIIQKGCITTIAFSNSGKYFACGSEDKIFCLYSSCTSLPLEAHRTDRSVISINFNSTDNILLVACYDTIQLFDITHNSFHARPDKPKIEKIFHTEFVSPDKFVVCSENYAVRLYKVGKKGPKLKASLVPKVPTTASWICPAKEFHEFAVGYQTGTIRIWDPQTCRVIYENGLHQNPIIQILFQGSTFISLSQDGCIGFINVASYVVERKIYLKGCSLHSKSRMAIFDKSILIGGDDGLVHEYSIIDGKFISTWPLFHTSPITSISACKKYIVTGDKNGIIKVWTR